MHKTERPLNPQGVILATITFYPEISGTSLVLTDLALSLTKQGMKVKVYTAQPHYYKKHDKLPNRESYQGVDIIRLPSTTFDKNFRFGRILNWASFAFSSFMALLFDRNTYPLLMVSSPPVLPFAGWLLKKLRGRTFVYLVHDVYPEIGVKLGFFQENGFTVKIWNFLNRRAYKSASKIIVLSEDMGRLVRKQMGSSVKNGKIEVIHNWADESSLKPIPKNENLFLKNNPLPYDFLVQYSGNMGFNHELEPLIEAARTLKDLNIGFVFIGEGGKKAKLQLMCEQYGLKNVKFFPFQPQETLCHSLCAADLSVVSLEKGLEGMAVPSKFYPLLAAGRPVLALMSDECDIASIVKRYECGVVLPPQGDLARLVETLRQCYRDRNWVLRMGTNARRCFEENFTREKATNRYASLLGMF